MKYLFRAAAEFLEGVLHKIVGAWSSSSFILSICALYYVSSNFSISIHSPFFLILWDTRRKLFSSCNWKKPWLEWEWKVLFTSLHPLKFYVCMEKKNLKQLNITFFSIIQFSTFYYYIPFTTSFSPHTPCVMSPLSGAVEIFLLQFKWKWRNGDLGQ